MSVAVGVVAFAGGVWLLVVSVEGLVRALQAWAAAAGLSGLVLAALVLGFDLESTAAGVAAALRDLPGSALGTSIGASIFLLTAGLGIAAIVAPFRVEVPRGALAVAAVASILPLPLMLDGELSRLDGALLLGAFVPLLIALFRTRSVGATGLEPAQRPSRLALRLLLGLAGLLVGAQLLVLGAERIVGGLGISETVFGLLVVGVAVSLEEVLLEALPAYRGFPELAVGNALGTVLFLLTASLGLIVLIHPLAVPDSVRSFHGPALLAASLVSLSLLARGGVGLRAGAFLVAVYVVYAGLSIAAG